MMKLIRSGRVLPTLLAIGLVAGCGSSTTPAPERGAFVGRIDGHLWVGDARAFLSTGTPRGDVLYVHGTSPRGADAWGADETLTASVIFTGPGLYPLDVGDVTFFELVGGDVVSAQYSGSGSPAGFLRVTRYDGPGGVIEGELRFTATTTSEYASYGPTARFEDGRFHAVVTAQAANVLAASP
jgi:hypothetical protein